MACSSSGCFTNSVETIHGISLCEEHRSLLTAYLTPVIEPVPLNVVYYVTWRNSEFVKIGTTQNITKRLRSLSKHKEHPILMATEPGGYYLEKKRHRQFSHLRQGASELFRYTDQLGEHIKSLT